MSIKLQKSFKIYCTVVMGKNHGFRVNQQGFAACILSMEKNQKIVRMRLITQQYFHGQKEVYQLFIELRDTKRGLRISK